MRKWKIALGAAVAVGAISVASVHLLDMGNFGLNAGTAGAATPEPAASNRARPLRRVPGGQEFLLAWDPVRQKEAWRVAAVLRTRPRNLGNQGFQQLGLASAEVAHDPNVKLVKASVRDVELQVARAERVNRLPNLKDDALAYAA